MASGVVTGVRMHDDLVEIDTHDARALAPPSRRSPQRNPPPLEVKPLDESLESVFRYLVERR